MLKRLHVKGLPLGAHVKFSVGALREKEQLIDKPDWQIILRDDDQSVLMTLISEDGVTETRIWTPMPGDNYYHI